MRLPFNRPKPPTRLQEIHDYGMDIERMMDIRDKARSGDERQQLDTVVNVMLKVMQRLNEKLLPKR